LKKSVTDSILRNENSTKEIANITQQRMRLKADYFEEANNDQTTDKYEQAQQQQQQQQQQQEPQEQTNINKDEEEKEKEIENEKEENVEVKEEPKITSNIDGKIKKKKDRKKNKHE